MKKSPLKTVLGQPSWRIASPGVEAFVTQTGGHLGPVTFDRRGRKITPLSVAPWAKEKLDRSTPAIIKALRGDFFCLPFGGNGTSWQGEQHPPHGETANAKWKLEDASASHLHLSLQTRIRPGHVDKHVILKDDHNAVYQRHIVRDMAGPMNFGHHAMLQFPDVPNCGAISTSPFVFAQVYPEPIEQPANRGYSILKPAAVFTSLASVPTITGDKADLSHYPARRGFEDLVMLVADDRLPFAWTAVTFAEQRYVWFALKDPRVLRETIFWISNGGRHYAPWNGRHVNVMGLEEVTSYFHPGLSESVRDNALTARGIQTHLRLDPQRPLAVNYIMATVAIPVGFDRVMSIDARGDGVVLRSASGKTAHAPLDIGFLRERAGT